MKKTVFTVIMALCGLTAMATPPNLALESLFDGRYNGKKDISVSYIKSPGNYYRNIEVTNNPELVKSIEKLVEKDAKRASNYNDTYDGGEHTTIFQVPSNGTQINIGVTREGPKGITVFIQGPESAFK